MAAKIEVPEVLANPDTEPEAAHLRNVLRRLQIMLESEPLPLAKAEQVISEALSRPRTNGKVVDKLTKLNGDLQTDNLDLKARVSVLEMELAFERSQTRTFWAWLRQRFLCWRRGHEMAGESDRQCLHCGKKEDVT